MFWLSIGILFSSTLDAIGVGLVLPFLAFADSPESIYESEWIQPFSSYLQTFQQETILLILGLVFVFVYIFKSIVSVKINLLCAAFAFEQDTVMRVRVLTQLLNAPYEYHLINDRAKILNAIVQNINKFSFSLLALLRLGSESFVIIFLLLLLLWVSPASFLILALSLLCVSFIFFIVTYGAPKKWGTLSVNSNREMLKSIQEAIEGIKELRTLQIESSFIDRLKKAGKIAEKSSLGLTAVSILPRYFLEFGFVFILVVLVVVSSFANESFADLIPLLALIGLAGSRILPSLNIVISSSTIVSNSFPAVENIFFDLKETDISSNSTKKKQLPISETFESIKLKNVSYKYPATRKLVLDNIDLTIVRNDTLGIVGASGAGKTTLLDLILGFLHPTNGSITVNGEIIDDHISSWWSMIAYIPQTPFLSDDTVRSNIALGFNKELIDETRIESSIQSAQLGEFVKDLPNGLDTMIGDRGVRLSGGQKQRIAIARALYHNRQVLIFDEATSALDENTEYEIVSAIRKLQGLKTVIIIAHRLSTLTFCDRIIEIECSKIKSTKNTNSIR